jgi:hypothetical protein
VRKIAFEEVLDLVAYEKVREARRAEIIALKRHRRAALGDNLSLLFENHATVLFQIQEMLRTERIVQDDKIQDEIDAYNPLVPEPGELSATLFIEIPDLHLMSQQQVRDRVKRFLGLEQHVWLCLGDATRVPARFEDGHSSEEKMAAVHYLRFAVSPAARDLLADAGAACRFVVDHPLYAAETPVAPELRTELLRDLAG